MGILAQFELRLEPLRYEHLEKRLGGYVPLASQQFESSIGFESRSEIVCEDGRRFGRVVRLPLRQSI
jgi:hypothetical protein